MEQIKAVQDNDGHWYVIPCKEGLPEKFDYLLEKLEEFDYDDDELNKEFDETFEQYRTGGDLNLIQLYAEI